MDWDAIGALGEIVGALAVILTLFYLAQQIRQQNANTDLSMQESILDGFNAINSQLANDEALATLFLRGLCTPDQLTDGQATQFQWMFRCYVNCYLKIYRLHQKGVISEEDWVGHAAHGAAFFNTPGGTRWMSSQGGVVFQDFFDAIQRMTHDDIAIDFSLGRLENWN